MIDAMRALGLKGMAGAFDEAVTAGVHRQRTITEILSDLLRAEAAHRHAASIRYRMSAARLPVVKDIDAFVFENTPVNEGLVRSLHAGSFLPGKRNIVLVGGTGTGKTHLAIAITASVVRAGARGRYFNTVDLVTRLTETQKLTLRILARQVEAQLALRCEIIRRDLQAAQQTTTLESLRWTANHDGLTTLLNRNAFEERLSDAVRCACADHGRAAVMLVDIDHFKQVNDANGHDAGDALLHTFATRLREVVRSNDIVGRLGGDEFGIITPGFGSDEQLARWIQSVNQRLREPFVHAGRSIECRASIGVAIYPDHADNADSLMKCSDLALAAAKTQRACAVTFEPKMAADFDRERCLLAAARSALDLDEIVPYYQPKVELKSGRLSGFEALMRWKRSDGTVGLPEQFAPAFADTELSAAIGDRMISRVLEDMHGWLVAGVSFGHVAINACAGDFAANDFGERIVEMLASRGIPPSMIEIEVTEGIFMGRGSFHVERALKLLSANGVRIALDDFGTGYASLTHLRRFPVDVLKIDRSFVAGLGQNDDDYAIVRSVMALGKGLGIALVAEGIETIEQASMLDEGACDIGQGFLFGAAVSASEVLATIERIGVRLDQSFELQPEHRLRKRNEGVRSTSNPSRRSRSAARMTKKEIGAAYLY